MSPGVERAVAAARDWATQLGSPNIRLAHLVLALLDEEEGRPAILVQNLGQNLVEIRNRLTSMQDFLTPAPDSAVLFTAARNWSIRYRHDPEFLTDAYLIAVLRADPDFEKAASAIGLPVDQLEQLLFAPSHASPTPFSQHEPQFGAFSVPDPVDERDVARVIDVNLNRAREAARVIEDYCRFVLSDRLLVEELKGLRHGIASLTGLPSHSLLLSSRETLQDVGVQVTAGGEYERATPRHVAIANLKRLQESLRSLEEFGKLNSSELAQQLETLRYQAYTLERAIGGSGRTHERICAAKLYVLVTGERCYGAIDWTIERVAAAGADVVQLREKTLTDRELLARAKQVRRWTRDAGVLFIVNDRPDIARLVEADGVHLGQDDLPVAEARRLLGENAIIGVSTHTIEQVRQALLDGADYLGVGPVFPSRTKSFDQFPGLEFVRAATAATSLPLFALGGIGPENVHEVVAAGSQRVAVGSAITTVADPEQATRRLRVALDS